MSKQAINSAIAIDTIGKLRKAVRIADRVFMQVRFGCSEKWVRITKVEIEFLLEGYDDTDTVEDMEMFGDSFARVYGNNDLYVG